MCCTLLIKEIAELKTLVRNLANNAYGKKSAHDIIDFFPITSMAGFEELCHKIDTEEDFSARLVILHNS